MTAADVPTPLTGPERARRDLAWLEAVDWPTPRPCTSVPGCERDATWTVTVHHGADGSVCHIDLVCGAHHAAIRNLADRVPCLCGRVTKTVFAPLAPIPARDNEDGTT